MKARITTTVTIDATPAEVFTYLSNLKYLYLWNPQMRDVSPVTRLKKGTKYKTVSLILGMRIEADNEVTVFAQDEEIQIENNTGTVRFCVNFRLNSKSKKTQVVCVSVVSSDSSYFAFATPVLKALARREMQTDMQALKVAVEHKLN